MARPTLDHVKLGEAQGRLTAFLMRLGVEDARVHAEEFMRELVLEGWRHTRDRVELEPTSTGVPQAPNESDAYQEARERLRAEVEAGERR